MFEKFGKMDYEELIRTAAAEREEGDLEALVTLAVEKWSGKRRCRRLHGLYRGLSCNSLHGSSCQNRR